MAARPDVMFTRMNSNGSAIESAARSVVPQSVRHAVRVSANMRMNMPTMAIGTRKFIALEPLGISDDATGNSTIRESISARLLIRSK